MKSSCKGLEVFDFTEQDEQPEMVAAKYSRRFKGGAHDLDKYTFLQNVAQGTNMQMKDMGTILCVDVETINSDHDDDFTASIASLDGENFAVKSASTLLRNGSNHADQLPHFEPNELEPRSSCTRTESSSSPEAASPGNSKFDCPRLESSSSDESIDTVSDADESLSERSVSTSSVMAEDDVPIDVPSSDHCFGNWQFGDGVSEVVCYPDYIVYQDKYCTDSVLKFSSSCIEIKGSTANGDHGTFVSQWRVDDIINIESQWCGKFELAMVKIFVISEGSVRVGDVHGSSGVEELKFAVVDSNWCEKQEAITSLDVYKPLWNIVLDSDMERDGEAFLGQNGSVVSKRYFPTFKEPFEDVIYPKGDPDAVSISKRDFDLLQPDTFINDTIIDFYIKYLKDKIVPDERHRFHFFNSFFFRKLADLDKNPSSAFEGRAAFQRVRKWTRKINLFEKDYVFIPVNFNYHWSLIVICHPGEVAEFKGNSPKVPCILHMDSIRGTHSGLKDLLQSYLLEEWKERQMETSEDISSKFLNLRFLSLELPQQQNFYDCGLFLLHYVELFLEGAPVNFNPFKITKFSNFLTADWFQPFEAFLKRSHIQRLIYDLLDDCSHINSPDGGCDKHDTSNCSKSFDKNETAVEILSERCSPLKDFHGNVLSSQAGPGIEMTLLPTSSLKSSQCASDSNLVLRELFEPGAPVGSYYQAFGQAAPFDEFKIPMPPIEGEENAGRQFNDSPSTQTVLEQLAGITAEEDNYLPCPASWNNEIPLHQATTAREDIVSLPETSVLASEDLMEVDEVNDDSQVGANLNLEDKVDQSISPTTDRDKATATL